MGTCQVLKKTTPFRSQLISKPPSFNILGLSQNSQLNQVQYSFAVYQQSDLQQWQHCLKSIKSSDCPYYYLWLPQKKKYTPRGMLCSQSGQLQLIFQIYQENLENRLGRYRKGRNKMREGEIWYLLYTLCKVGRYFQKIGRRVGNVSPQNILYNTKDEIRIICSLSYPFLNQQLFFFQSQDKTTMIPANQYFRTFLAPQQLKCDRGEKDNLNVNEVFSVGMTILQCTTFERLQNLYVKSQGQYQLSQTKIRCLIHKAESKYSPMLISFLGQMLQWNPSQRPKLSELYRLLEKYQTSILRHTFAGDNSSSLVTLKMSIVLQNKNSHLFRTSQVSQVNKQNNSSNLNNRYSNPYSYHKNSYSASSLRNTTA